MATHNSVRSKDAVLMTLGLMTKALPERAKAIEPDLIRIASTGSDALKQLETIDANEHLSPAGKRHAKLKVLTEAAVAVKKFKAKADEMTPGIEEARKRALAVPPQPEGTDKYASDEFMMTQLAKMSPAIVAKRYAEGLAGDARWHVVVRAVRKARELGIPIIEEMVQDVYDAHAFDNSPERPRVEASEEIQGFLTGLAGTVDRALRNVAQEDGLEPEYIVALETGKAVTDPPPVAGLPKMPGL